MARHDDSKTASNSFDEAHAQLLYTSVDQYNQELRRRKRPSIILAALVILFLSSATGISLAIVLIVKAAEIAEKASLPRDLIFFAGVLSLLYICMHIRGARKDYKRKSTGPPQKHGHYLHASALLVARLGIVTWFGALVATAVTTAKDSPSHQVAILNLLLCTSAIPPFLIITFTIERNSTPFATAALSRSSFLTCRTSDFGDDLEADASVSRRATVVQRQPSECGSVLTLPTEEIFRLGAPKDDEKLAEPEGYEQVVQNFTVGTPLLTTSSTISAPQQTYYPGGWRAEWGRGAGRIRMSPAFINAHAASTITYGTDTSSSGPQPPAPSTVTSYDCRAGRSDLSTVRYVSLPEIAVRQPIRVVRNPAYAPKPDPSRESLDERKPSNFSRPIPMRDSGIDVRIPGAYHEETREL